MSSYAAIIAESFGYVCGDVLRTFFPCAVEPFVAGKRSSLRVLRDADSAQRAPLN